ncbi:MAG: peptidylprolyl isomerase [Bacteroidales bacterium]
MKKITVLIFLFTLLVNTIEAQKNNDIFLSIDGKEITKEEFVRIYKKNNRNLDSGKKTSVDEYLDMFINLKLKVAEAENMGIDTITSVKEEIKKHKNELAKPYLIDSQEFKNLVEEAYERSQKEIRASHILVKFPQKKSYEDTLRAYKKTKNIRKRIIKKDEDFKEVAVATSDDPSVKTNEGDVGYFSVFKMVYPFENAVYQMDPDEISKPVRTQYGYHIIKKTDEREAKGRIKVAHILLLAPESMEKSKREAKKEDINDIYHKIMSGENFEELAMEYSEDKGSARNGGELPWFSVGRMVPEFEEAAFSLENKGDITRPVKTRIGWHIIKLIDREEIGSFEEAKKTIENKIQNDERYQIARDSLIEDLKKKYDFELKKENLANIKDKLLNEEDELLTSKISSLTNNKEILFNFNETDYKVSDFASYLNELPDDLKNNYKDKYLFDKALERFISSKIIDYEKSLLKDKYKNYKYALREYYDGILLFEIMDRKVWEKASEDTAGLEKFYQKNKDKYMWPQQYEGKIYLCDDESTLKKVKKMKKGGLFKKSHSDEKIIEELNTDEKTKVEIKKGTFQKGDNPIIDYQVWNIGNDKDLPQDKYFMVQGEIIQERIKTLKEARGEVIADYQEQLEEEWINELREKYQVDINQEILEEVKQELSK